MVAYLFIGFIIAVAILSDDADYYGAAPLFITFLWPVIIVILLYHIVKETCRW